MCLLKAYSFYSYKQLLKILKASLSSIRTHVKSVNDELIRNDILGIKDACKKTFYFKTKNPTN